MKQGALDPVLPLAQTKGALDGLHEQRLADDMRRRVSLQHASASFRLARFRNDNLTKPASGSLPTRTT